MRQSHQLTIFAVVGVGAGFDIAFTEHVYDPPEQPASPKFDLIDPLVDSGLNLFCQKCLGSTLKDMETREGECYVLDILGIVP